jgi:ABC-type glycerol-3-phosphate transport system permease component
MIGRAFNYTFLFTVSLVSTIPLLWVWLSAFRTSADIADNPLGLPIPPHPENLVKAWEVGRIGLYALNSLEVAVGTVIVVLVCSVLAGYALTCLDLPASDAVFVFLLLGLMVPTWALIMPLYYQLRDLSLINSLLGVILVQSALGLPFGVFMMRSFFRSFSREILDAAKIDGAGQLRTVLSIVTPLAGPAIKALAVFQFMWAWNELVVPLFFLQEEDLRTIPLGLTFLQGRFTSDTAVIAAGACVASLPVLVVYLLLSRQFIRGLTAGAVK